MLLYLCGDVQMYVLAAETGWFLIFMKKKKDEK